MNPRSSRGVKLVDVLVICTCSILVLVTASVVLGQVGPKQAAPSASHPLCIKDAAQLKQIHAAMVVFAEANKGRYPIPGLINRRAADLDGDGVGEVEIPDVGPEDIALNTTANLYSALIAMHFVSLESVISPVDRNPNMKVDDDYNFAAYSPAEDSYWDPRFEADLETGSNTSYAHLVIYGRRLKLHWRDTLEPRFPVLSNRGPKDGALGPSSFTCGPHGNWTGNVVFNDNHFEMLSTARPPHVTFMSNDEKHQDNLFAFDDGLAGNDTILTFTKQMIEDGPVIQYD